MEHRVVIIGAGRIGGAIGRVLRKKHIQVDFWDKDETLVPDQKPLEETIPTASVVFYCIPSFAINPVTDLIKGFLKKEIVIVSLAKSIEESTNRTMDQLLKDELPEGQAFSVLAGPLLAEELIEGDGGGVAVAASEEKKACDVIKDLFSGSVIRVVGTTDVRGAALCGVVKNMYAIGIGVADGLKLADNIRGSLTARALNEMPQLVADLGGAIDTVRGEAGYGDFIATAFSQHSGHRGYGEKVAHGEAFDDEREGCIALKAVLDMVGGSFGSYPLLDAIYRVVVDRDDARMTLNSVVAYE